MKRHPNHRDTTTLSYSKVALFQTSLFFSSAAILINYIIKIHTPSFNSGSWGSKDTALKFQTQAKAKQPRYSSQPIVKHCFPAESADLQFKIKVTIKT